MLSKFARAATLGARPSFASVQAVAEFHSARVLCDSKPAADAPTGPVIDKTNILVAPDNFEPWRNAGYGNLAPKGWSEWSDLPAPYKYYEVKVDPKDVENEGLAWKTLTNWKTALPVTALLALPAFVFDVVVIDERFELMLIFWSTMAIFQANLGASIKKTLTDQIDQIRSELLGAEKKYNAALDSSLEAHKKGQYLIDSVIAINAADRALKAIEAAAKTRQVKIDQRNKYRDMLDYLVSISESKEGQALQVVNSRTRAAVEKTLSTDKALQQQLIEDAIKALQTGERIDATVPQLYEKTFDATCDALDAELESAEPVDAQAKELFTKRFEFNTVVTQEQIKKAQTDAAEAALLVAKVGGGKAVVGAPIVQKSPLDYLL